MNPLKDIINQKFNRLLCIEFFEIRNKKSFHKFLCDCGRIVSVQSYLVTSGNTKSCGCLRTEKSAARLSIIAKSKRKPIKQFALNQIIVMYKFNSSDKNREFSLSKEQVNNIVFNKCYYCGSKPMNTLTNSKTKESINYNGIDRVNNDLGYKLDNVRTCCIICNRGKNNMNSQEFENYIKQVALHNSMEISLGFEHVATKQKKNICVSRLSVDTSSEIFRGFNVNIPIIASNMSTVINPDFLMNIIKNGAFGFLHRAQSETEYLEEVKYLAKNCEHVPVSIGIGNEQYELGKKLIKNGANFVLIDIAHGYCDEVINLGRKLKTEYPNIKMIVGNTANVDMMYEVADFADAVKVGIAQGFACETKNTAGCTEKQFSCNMKFKQISKELGLPIISDGGIREPGDVTKAIGSGANSVMAGSIFAACPESAAETVEMDNGFKKLYAGMASEHVQNTWKGGLKPGTCAEGGIRYLDIGLPLVKLLERYQGALRTGITYAGGKDIKTLQENVEFIRIMN